jgi:hypothetical protein
LSMMKKECGLGRCYLCNREFDKEVKSHEEHIIHNALGGQLTSKSILCEKCGNILNETVDKKFLKLFENIYGRLNLRRDRGKAIKLFGTWKGKKVIYEKGNIYPQRPFEIEKEDCIEIYSSKKIFENYKKKFKNTKKKIKHKEIPLKEVKFDVLIDRESEEYKLGLLKIAVEFVLEKGIFISNLEQIKKILLKKSKNNIEIIHFLPLGVLDKLIELQKEDLFPYPFHKIIVFNYATNLIVYIELFSTFQEYIILDTQYKGNDIFECFMQKILKEEELEVNIDYRRYYKERNLYFEPLGISLEEVEKRYKEYKQYCKDNCLSQEKWEWKLIKEETRKRKYLIYCNEYIQNAIQRVNNQFLFFPIIYNKNFIYQKNNLYRNDNIVKKLKLMYKFENNNFLDFSYNNFLFYRINGEIETFIPDAYKKLFIKNQKQYFYPFICKDKKLKICQNRYYKFMLNKLEKYILGQYEI